jgi:hypothetical protein
MSVIDQQAEEIIRLKRELAAVRAEAQAAFIEHAHQLQQCRSDGALMVRALNAALVWGEALFGWLPEGMVLSDGVKSAKSQLDMAMELLGRQSRERRLD